MLSEQTLLRHGCYALSEAILHLSRRLYFAEAALRRSGRVRPGFSRTQVPTIPAEVNRTVELVRVAVLAWFGHSRPLLFLIGVSKRLQRVLNLA